MRTASDFDRAPPGETEVFHLLQVAFNMYSVDFAKCVNSYADQMGFTPSIENIFIAGYAILEDVLKNWNSVYKGGIKPGNYVGDLFNSLGAWNPDIGSAAIYIN
jgi:purine nucleoside permease